MPLCAAPGLNVRFLHAPHAPFICQLKQAVLWRSFDRVVGDPASINDPISLHSHMFPMVVLCKLSDGNVVTLPLVADYYPQAQELAYPHAYTIAAVLDLNGDGRLEIVVAGARYEGGMTSVYEVASAIVQRVLNAGCSE